MLPWHTMTTMTKERKCRFYNRGYCKNKDSCKDYHPDSDCPSNCTEYECRNRHRQMCRYKNDCYHNYEGKCEYLHQTAEAHEVILTTMSPVFKDNYENEKKKADNLEKLNKNQESEIEKLKDEIEELKQQTAEAHKVILTTASPVFKDNYENEKKKADNLEKLNQKYGLAYC